jgi:hypothetical protein
MTWSMRWLGGEHNLDERIPTHDLIRRARQQTLHETPMPGGAPQPSPSIAGRASVVARLVVRELGHEARGDVRGCSEGCEYLLCRDPAVPFPSGGN